jgi:hypothetical protein
MRRLGTTGHAGLRGARGTAADTRIRFCLAGLAAQFVLYGVAAAQSQQTNSNGPPLMDRQRQIALALSACPPALASKAGIYVLDRNGYVKVRNSENGFTAIIQHSTPAMNEPQCLDPEGSRTYLQRYLRVAEWRSHGKTPQEIRQLLTDALAKGDLMPPSRPGIIYMLSSINTVLDANGGVAHFPPHVMFFGTKLTNADLASARRSVLTASP